MEDGVFYLNLRDQGMTSQKMPYLNRGLNPLSSGELKAQVQRNLGKSAVPPAKFMRIGLASVQFEDILGMGWHSPTFIEFGNVWHSGFSGEFAACTDNLCNPCMSVRGHPRNKDII